MRRQQFGVVIAALVVAITTPVVATVAASPASATAYRYWSYWHAPTSSWDFSRVGATGYRPSDGSAEGWRFAVSPGTASAPAPRQPAASAFDTICGSTSAEAGKKRVALVVDFGTDADSPSGDSPPSDELRGSCVSIRTNATGTDVLVAAGYSMRTDDSNMVCGLAGYPTQGCGEVVADATAPPAGSDDEPTARATATSGSNSGKGSSGANRSGDDSIQSGSTTKASASAASSSVAGGTASPTASATAASNGAIPSAAALDSSSAAPSLVVGAPAADTSGSSSNPLRAGLAVLLVAVIAGAALVRNRAIRRVGKSS